MPLFKTFGGLSRSKQVLLAKSGGRSALANGIVLPPFECFALLKKPPVDKTFCTLSDVTGQSTSHKTASEELLVHSPMAS